ncbi:hypothetical protein F8M41_013872 [Gigaspora margarita]|uniref:Uncharacterized protein n=1 Tax=Gigaspora margarita TaxID=4874 RepID=A0A8H4A061_GIGMA|nr:hypothetical protein F8M41_013872 [Gigaspora margarita]
MLTISNSDRELCLRYSRLVSGLGRCPELRFLFFVFFNIGDLGSNEPDLGSFDLILVHEPGLGSSEPDVGSFEPNLGSNEPGLGTNELDLGAMSPI